MNKVPYVIWQFWTGKNEMSEDRRKALETSSNLNVETKFLTADEIFQYEKPEHRFHPAYKYLSCNHQSDYLRCYFLHFYGGGYADIKHYSKDNNWKESIDLMNSGGRFDVVGQAESKGGAAYSRWNREPYLSRLVCTSYLTARPKSDFTHRWLWSVERILSSKLKELKVHPATQPRQRVQGDYPLRWLDVMGYPFHSLCQSYFGTGKIARSLIAGRMFVEYR